MSIVHVTSKKPTSERDIHLDSRCRPQLAPNAHPTTVILHPQSPHLLPLLSNLQTPPIRRVLLSQHLYLRIFGGVKSKDMLCQGDNEKSSGVPIIGIEDDDDEDFKEMVEWVDTEYDGESIDDNEEGDKEMSGDTSRREPNTEVSTASAIVSFLFVLDMQFNISPRFDLNLRPFRLEIETEETVVAAVLVDDRLPNNNTASDSPSRRRR